MTATQEFTKDFVGETRDVKLKNGLVVKITTPTVRWWFDFLLPKQKELQWTNVSPEVQQQIIKEAKKGKIAPATLKQMPEPMLEMLLEIVVYYVKKDKDWCKDHMDLVDFLVVFNGFLEVVDIKRIADFFVKINQQLPLATLFGQTKKD